MAEEKKVEETDKKDIEENKLIAALSYVWVLCLVPLLGKKSSKFAQFHAKQGLILFLLEIVGMFVFWIPIFGWLLFLILLVVSVVGIFQALNGNYWEIPVIGHYAKKIKL